ncbi:MAG: gamma-glutamyl-phosphate reductase, partial [Eubacteriales bacterium]
MDLTQICQNARRAAFTLANAGARKDEALSRIHDRLLADAAEILSANAADLENARQKGTSDAMLDRLTLTAPRIAAIAEAVLKVRALPEVLGTGEVFTRPNGLEIRKVCVPLGVIGIIY